MLSLVQKIFQLLKSPGGPLQPLDPGCEDRSGVFQHSAGASWDIFGERVRDSRLCAISSSSLVSISRSASSDRVDRGGRQRSATVSRSFSLSPPALRRCVWVLPSTTGETDDGRSSPAFEYLDDNLQDLTSPAVLQGTDTSPNLLEAHHSHPHSECSGVEDTTKDSSRGNLDDQIDVSSPLRFHEDHSKDPNSKTLQNTQADSTSNSINHSRGSTSNDKAEVLPTEEVPEVSLRSQRLEVCEDIIEKREVLQVENISKPSQAHEVLRMPFPTTKSVTVGFKLQREQTTESEVSVEGDANIAAVTKII